MKEMTREQRKTLIVEAMEKFTGDRVFILGLMMAKEQLKEELNKLSEGLKKDVIEMVMAEDITNNDIALTQLGRLVSCKVQSETIIGMNSVIEDIHYYIEYCEEMNTKLEEKEEHEEVDERKEVTCEEVLEVLMKLVEKE